MSGSTTLEWDLRCLNSLEQLGEFDNALNGYRVVLDEVPDHDITTFRYRRLLRDLREDEVSKFHLIWQVDSIHGRQWEVDWIRRIFAGLAPHEVHDGQHKIFMDGAIIVDCSLTPQKAQYYFEMLKRGHRFAIIHLSDEQYQDDWSAYKYANCVIRNYWSPMITDRRNVLALPLGYKSGFVVHSRKPTQERPYVWSFIGAVNRSIRTTMISAMRTVAGGFEHTTGFGNLDPSALDPSIVIKPWMAISEYAAMLGNTIFSPCPIGMQNLDSFRVCESLEAGCIPIVERRNNHDYFTHLFGRHPMITIDNWEQAPAIIAALISAPVAMEARRKQCEQWWDTYRDGIVQRVKDHITDNFKGRLR